MPRKSPSNKANLNKGALVGQTGIRCLTCSHPHVKEINRRIAKGETFNALAVEFAVEGVKKTAMQVRLGRHAETCLNLGIAALIQEGKNKQANEIVVDVLGEFQKNLSYIKQMRDALWEWLMSPDGSGITLDPRAEEIKVIYISRRLRRGSDIDTTRHVTTLQKLIDRLESDERADVRQILELSPKYVDNRLLMLKTVELCDTVLDKFAKMTGLYKQPEANPNDIRTRAAEALEFVRWGVSLANSDEAKAAHALGENISLEFALSTVEMTMQDSGDGPVFGEMRRLLTD